MNGIIDSSLALLPIVRLFLMDSSAAKILIIDDNEAYSYAMAHVLNKHGYEVIEVATGNEGLRFAREKPDLIILDVHLPDLAGHDVARKLKSDVLTAKIPILQTSAQYTMEEDYVEGLESGADAYLTQPMNPFVLLSTVKALLRLSSVEHLWQQNQARLILEQKLQKSEKKLKQLAELKSVGFGIITADGTLKNFTASLEKLTGLSREQLQDKKLPGPSPVNFQLKPTELRELRSGRKESFTFRRGEKEELLFKISWIGGADENDEELLLTCEKIREEEKEGQ